MHGRVGGWRRKQLLKTLLITISDQFIPCTFPNLLNFSLNSSGVISSSFSTIFGSLSTENCCTAAYIFPSLAPRQTRFTVSPNGIFEKLILPLAFQYPPIADLFFSNINIEAK